MQSTNQYSSTRSFHKLLWVVQSSVGCIRPCRPLARVRYMDVESQTALSVYMTKREKKKIKNRLDYRVAEVAQRCEGPSPESLDLDENCKPKHKLFCCDVKNCWKITNAHLAKVLWPFLPSSKGCQLLPPRCIYYGGSLRTIK